MPIAVLEEHQIFALETKEMSYVFGINPANELQHLYWGDRVNALDCLDLLKRFGYSSFDQEAGREKEEFSFWGGFAYTEPCLKVNFQNSVRDLKMKFDGYQLVSASDHELLVITLKDIQYGITVRLNYKLIENYNLIERNAEIINTSNNDILLENVKSASWSIPALPQYRFQHVTGKWSGEYQMRSTLLSEGKKVIESRRGITSHQANPWFVIDDGNSNEDMGKVWFGALAWSGNWSIVAEKTVFNHVKVVGGIHDFDFSWQLKPGETFATPVFVGGYSSSGFGSMSRNLHQYQNHAVIPDNHAAKPRKVLYNSWEATSFDVQANDQMLLAEKAAKLGVELFVIDDGWFGQRNTSKAGLGDWYVNPDKFPDGLTPLIQRVNELGMDFGIWVEPEMVNPDSDLYRAHPDWVYHFPDRPRSEARNQLVLNLSKPEVKQFILDFLTDLLSKHHIQFVKWDMNRTISEPGWPEAAEVNQREIWVRHVHSLYEIFALLRERFPHVVFESCSGGGGRTDLGILHLTDQVWVSDNTDPFDRLFIQEGFSYTYSPKTMMCWVTDSPNFVNTRVTSLKFRFHSAMMGSLGIGGNLNKWSEEELAEAAEHIALYKAIRPLVQDGKQYRLLSPRCGNLAAVQYVNEDQTEAVVFVLLHSKQFRNRIPHVQLRGLAIDKLYSVEGRELPISGSGLMNIGLDVQLKGDFDSALIRIKEV